MSVLFFFTLIFAPLYVWRFNVAGLPTNFLMLWSAGVILVSLLYIVRERQFTSFVSTVLHMPRWILIVAAGWLLAGTISLFQFGISVDKLGQWVVLFVEPIAVGACAYFFAQRDVKVKERMQTAAYVIVGTAGLLAIIQYVTLWTLPEMWWGNSVEPKRAIAFFAYANAYGLFAAPFLAWLIPDVYQRVRNVMQASWYSRVYIVIWCVGVVGMFFSLSRGAWLGSVLAFGAFVILSANKKLLLSTVVAGVVLASIVAIVPNLRYRVTLPFYGEKSAVSRLSLWETATKMIGDNPILGKGLNGFGIFWTEYNTDPNLVHYEYPHNIVLNTWVTTGLLGVVSFVGLILFALWQGFWHRTDRWKLGLLLFMVALTAHGLIDVPYFKNDLAMMFWLVWAVAI